jgi:hypothetical protein
MSKAARYLLFGALCTLFIVQQAWADAATPGSTVPVAVVPEVSVVKESPATPPQDHVRLLPREEECPVHPYRVRMGERIFIEATGSYATSIKEALNAGSAFRALSLYFDGTQVPGAVGQISSDNEGRLVVFFDIERDTFDPENRKGWDAIFTRKSSFDMPFLLSVSAGKNGPWPVAVVPVPLSEACKKQVSVESATFMELGRSKDGGRTKFIFYVGSPLRVILTALMCLVLLIAGYFQLVKTNALRDGGANTLYSLGRSQMAFWGLLVVLAFVAVLFINGTMEDIPLQMLMLLGITGGTGLAAFVIGESKANTSLTELEALRVERTALNAKATPTPDEQRHLNELTAKIQLREAQVSPPSVSFWNDICNDGSGLSFHRLQVVIWTLVLGAVFVVSVIQTMSMPEFPGSLLILMGVSNVTYLGFKIPEKASVATTTEPVKSTTVAQPSSVPVPGATPPAH